MAIERKWEAIALRPFTQNGGSDGHVFLASTSKIKVKQEVRISATGEPTLVLQVKRVISSIEFIVGPKAGGLDATQDLSAYTLAKSAYFEAFEQPRPAIPITEHERAVYEEEPTVAKRVVLVDEFGNKYAEDNPLSVQLSDGSINIGTVNAELEVALSHRDNDPDAGDVADSVRIGDGEDELEVNPDGSINVNTITGSGFELKSTYAEITAVPTNTPTTVASYTAPIGVNTFLHKIFCSGENIATFKVKLNGVVIDKKRTYFGGNLNCEFDFSSSSAARPIDEGDIIELEVEHFRLDVADFNGRIQIIEQ